MRKLTEKEQQKLDEFNKQQEEILADIPEEFHAPMKRLAWEEGYSGGYSEVINYLLDLHSAFSGPIEQYTERIQREEAEEIEAHESLMRMEGQR